MKYITTFCVLSVITFAPMIAHAGKANQFEMSPEQKYRVDTASSEMAEMEAKALRRINVAIAVAEAEITIVEMERMKGRPIVSTQCVAGYVLVLAWTQNQMNVQQMRSSSGGTVTCKEKENE